MYDTSFKNVKLTDQQVYEILYLNGFQDYSPSQLTKAYPVSKATIKNIISGKSRKDCYYTFMEYIERDFIEIHEIFYYLVAE